MQVVYNMLCICLGNPPKTFDFEYRDKDKQFHRECGLTPKKFYAKYIGLNLNDYISLINAPTADKPYYRSYTVQYLGNVAEGRQVRYGQSADRRAEKGCNCTDEGWRAGMVRL